VTADTAELTPTKPYLIRAIYEWCLDNGLTPYLAVRVDEHTQVPMAYVKDGEIVLNLDAQAVRDLHIGNEIISCGGRFGGVAHDIFVPVPAVIGIFARENGQGLAFEFQPYEPPPPPVTPASGGDDQPEPPRPAGRPNLRVVK
jgi:stringent starvation protein B